MKIEELFLLFYDKDSILLQMLIASRSRVDFGSKLIRFLKSWSLFLLRIIW